MELINKIRKSRKGFTLVEIIVVLVILAILAAFMIPSMLGFVGDAKKKAAITEQREVYIAAQAIATEYFAKDSATAATKLGIASATGTEAVNLGSGAVATDTAEAAKKMASYLGTDITANEAADDTGTTGINESKDNSTWSVKVNTTGQVTEVTYTKNGVTLDPLTPNSKVK